jgi:hypothetical protein
MPKRAKLKLPRAPIPKPGHPFKVKKDQSFRKRKHKGQRDE